MPNPTKIQWTSYPVCDEPITVTHVRLPNAAEAGDTIIITGQFGNGSDVISAIADDQGGSLAGAHWVKDKIQANAGNGQSVCILRRSNVPAGTRVVTITFSGATGFSNFQGILFNNLATASVVDGTPSGGNPTGTSLAAGNITTGTTNTVVVLVASETSGSALTNPTHFTAPANYTLWAPNGFDETCCMYGSQAAAGTFNPTLTAGHSWTASAVAACAYKTATSGGTPASTIEVRQMMCLNFNPSRTNGTATSFTVDLPCPTEINTVAFAYDDGNNIFTGSPAANTSSSPANTWSETTFTQAPSGPACGFVYSAKGSFSPTGTLSVSVSLAPTLTQRPFELYIWCMANGEAFDQVQTGTASLGTTPPVTETTVLDTALTPVQKNEVILFFNQEDSQTVTNITASSGTFIYLPPDNGIYESLKGVHDAGFGHLYTGSSIVAYNFDISWSEYEGNGDPVGPWCAQAVAFKSVPPPSRPMFRGH